MPYIVLLNVKMRKNPKVDLGQEARRNEDAAACMQQPLWLQSFAERPRLLAANCQALRRNIPFQLHPYHLVHSSVPSPRKGRTGGSTDPHVSQLSPTAYSHASLQGRQRRTHRSTPHKHNTIPLSSPVHWNSIFESQLGQNRMKNILWKGWVCFLWGYLFNISLLISQAFPTIHRISILHVLRDPKHIYWALCILNSKCFVNNN